MSFKKSNPLFAFASMSCERTQSFDIPATPNNERVFQLAKIPARYGDSMRRKFDCELQDGDIVKHGYLYVDAYNDGAYKAIFVTGELVGLQNLKNAGNIDEICKQVVSDAGYATRYGAAAERPWEGMFMTCPYLSNTVVKPCVDVRGLLAMIQAETGVRLTTGLPEIVGDKKLILTDVKPFEGVASRYTCTHSDGSGEAAAENGYAVQGTQHNLVLRGNIAAKYNWLVSSENVQQEWINANGRALYGYPTVFTALTTLAITFPADFPDNYYLIEDPRVNSYMQFWGDYSFVKSYDNVTRYGEPLAGRTVVIERGKKFVIVTDEHYTYSYNAMRWKFTSALDTYDLIISGGEEVNEGDMVTLANNLPDCSVMELLNTIAATAGRVLNYTDANGVSFDDLNTAAFETIDITGKVQKHGELSRKFGDYAQFNTIKTKQSEWIAHPHTRYARYKYIVSSYTVDNDNIEELRELLIIPFSEGAADNYGRLFVEYDEEDEKGETIKGEDKMVIANYYENGAEYIDPSWPKDPEQWTDEIWEEWLKYYNHSDVLKRISLPKNAGLQALCNASTSMSVSVRMLLRDYERITPRVKFLLDGTEYVWTEATWQNNVCTCKISKI